MRDGVRYAELHCITNYSFLRGASHPEELVAAAKALGHEGVAVADANVDGADVRRTLGELVDLQAPGAKRRKPNRYAE